MKAFIVAFLVVAAVSQGYGQFWQGGQGQSYQQFQPPQVNYQEMAQQYAPAAQKWWDNQQKSGFQLPQANFQELAQQYGPAMQNWRENMQQQRVPQMPANLGQQSPFAQNLKNQIPANYQQVLESSPFKSWADKVMTMPNVQGMKLPAQ